MVTSSTTEPTGGPRLLCSAKACRSAATTALLWNNPSLHTPDRRKVWLACEPHTPSLGQFLTARGFLRDTIPVAELTGGHG
ncbi:MAG: hypothetical protein M3171_00030 [Actinomycetota bacterium]|nr:hypothetical protein [Actinomycetota bacterium]